MTSSKRLVFFGNERLVSGLKHTDLPILNALVDNGYDIAAIVTHDTRAVSRSARPVEVVEFAKHHTIQLLTPDKPGDIVDELTALQADFAVLASYGRIIPERVLNVFEPIGIINIHPSLLPRYRGSTPIESAIIHGDTQTGVSIMKLSSGMDEGELYAQVTVNVEPTDDKFSLYERLAKSGAQLLVETLDSIASKQLQPTPQKNNDVSYTSQFTKADGHCDPLTEGATVIDRKIKAHLGYPKSRLSLFDNDVIVTSAKVVDSLSTNTLTIRCHNNTYLEVLSLVAPSGKTISGADYLRGYTNAAAS